jgi:CubicO group peptidase (beta-lactamase class C family)
VDVWAGIADRETGAHWGRDTVAVVRSTSKGATAICAHLLVERGELDLDAPVVEYWPEFGGGGKEQIVVRWLLAHQAGLPYVEAALTFEEACSWTPVIRALEAQRPLWTPGTQHAYHAWTFGFLVGEVIRRVTGVTAGTFFAREIAAPLGLSAWIGLPAEVEPRLARPDYEPPPPAESSTDAFLEELGLEGDEAREALLVMEQSLADPGSVSNRASTLGGAFPDPVTAFDSRAARAAEFPSSNLVTDARSLARMYASTVADVDGVRLLQPETVERMCIRQPGTAYGIPASIAEAFASPFALGFMRPSRLSPLLGPRSFGHPGRGGSLGCADPEARIGFGYVMNRMSADPRDRRAADLLDAVTVASDH